MIIRDANLNDLNKLQDLYLHLHETKKIPYSLELQELFQKMVDDENYHILIGEIEGKLIASVTLVVIPNLTRNARPYAIIENVVTHTALRKRGFGTKMIKEAIKLAQVKNCYKVMLLTSSHSEEIVKFYENCGFDRNEKIGFIRRF